MTSATCASVRTELAAGMERVEIARGKTLCFEKRNGQRIAKRQLHQVEVVGARPCGQASCSRGSSQHDVSLPRRASN
jgi:hypothetical protein